MAGGSRLFLESAAVLILERLAETACDEAARGSSNRIGRATDYMLCNLAQPISLLDLAQVVGLSPSQFLRVFKATTATSPHRFLRTARLERARDLLADNDAAIAEVALAVGFSNQSHFSAAFRNQFGTTPARFQRSPDRG
jgi:AraC family transcriptional regulator